MKKKDKRRKVKKSFGKKEKSYFAGLFDRMSSALDY